MSPTPETPRRAPMPCDRGPGILLDSKGKGERNLRGGARKFQHWLRPAMGWTSPLPAVRMRAAMLVSAVVATCRGRLRRGAIGEDGCWLHEWLGRRQLLNVLNLTVSESGPGPLWSMHAHTNMAVCRRTAVEASRRVRSSGCGTHPPRPRRSRARTLPGRAARLRIRTEHAVKRRQNLFLRAPAAR